MKRNKLLLVGAAAAILAAGYALAQPVLSRVTQINATES